MKYVLTIRQLLTLAMVIIMPISSPANPLGNTFKQTDWQQTNSSESALTLQVKRINFSVHGIDELLEYETLKSTPKSKLKVQNDFVRETTHPSANFKFSENPLSLIKAVNERLDLLKSYAGKDFNDAVRVSIKAPGGSPGLMIENITDKSNSSYLFSIVDSLEIDKNKVKLKFSAQW